MSYSFARREISIVYVSKSGSFIPVRDQYGICPGRGGVNSTWEKLPILMEFIGDFAYKLYTIEIHNPVLCNVNSLNAKRLNFLSIPYDTKYLTFLSLNDRSIIDVSYLRVFENYLVSDFDLDILEINFLTTKDNRNPELCEIRIFVEKK